MNLEKYTGAEIEIIIRNNKLEMYYKTADDGAIKIGEKLTRIGLQGQPSFLHQSEMHTSNPPKETYNDRRHFHEAVFEIVNDMHVSNEKISKMKITIDDKSFIATSVDLSAEEKQNNTVLHLDLAKEMLKVVLRDKVCVKEAGGESHHRSFVKTLNWNFGPSHYMTPEQKLTMEHNVHQMLSENKIKMPVLSK